MLECEGNMEKEPMEDKKKDGGLNSSASKRRQVMSSNLPLLIVKGRPRSLDTISQSQLEDFVPFMILCSLGQDQPKEDFKKINSCKTPEWWPQGFPFKYPLRERSHWTNRLVMLKSLVCRCYTFYNCEVLLKFSSQLAEMPSTNIQFKPDPNGRTTSIYNSNNNLLVVCRNVNLTYDQQKNTRFLAPSPGRPTLGSPKKFFPVIDLTFETSSEDENEVYFKEQTELPAPGKSSSKRKQSFEVIEDSATKQRCRRTFDDFPKEKPEPDVYDEDQFMIKFGLGRPGAKMPPSPRDEFNLPKEKKQRLSRCFNLLSVTSVRGQELLKKKCNSVNISECLERLDRFTSTAPVDGTANASSDQRATRASLTSGIILNDTDSTFNSIQQCTEQKWCHTFKWPHRTRKTSYYHKGPSIKPCSVKLVKITEQELIYWDRSKQTKATSTPPVWWLHNRPICKCVKIPLITLDDEDSLDLQKDKGTSTKCTCTIPQMPKLYPIPQQQSSAPLFNNSSVKRSPPALFEINPEVSSYTRDSTRVLPTFSNESTMTEADTYLDTYLFNIKKALQRRPLAVVSPSTIELSDSVTLCLPPSLSLSSLEISFNKSIVDAIKWYTRDEDSIISSVELSPNYHLENKGFAKERTHTQENIQPMLMIGDLNTSKSINYFRKTIDISDRDCCYANSPEDVQSKMMTRRGIRLYLNREPCPSCFQGQYNMCVYEFIRQAKLAGVPLRENEKQLQKLFFESVQKLSNQL